MSRPRHRVLVIADRSDDEATLVQEALEERGVRPAWIDTAEFPARLGLAFTVGAGDDMSAAVVLADGSEIELCEVEAIYRRSPAVFELDDDMSGPERRFAMAEAVQGVGGAFAALGCRWMNSPSRVADASYKPLQLAIACGAGFAVPRTLVTTTADRLRSFLGSVPGGTVYKPMSPGVITERGRTRVVNATLLDESSADLPGVDKTAHMFQEFIHKKYDARVNVIGDDMFAVVIETDDPAALVDWRANYDALTYRVVDVPDQIRGAIESYMARTGLLFAAFDFSVDGADTWWFLEANPNGKWAWVQEETGQSISDSVARQLVPAGRGGA